MDNGNGQGGAEDWRWACGEDDWARGVLVAVVGDGTGKDGGGVVRRGSGEVDHVHVLAFDPFVELVGGRAPSPSAVGLCKCAFGAGKVHAHATGTRAELAARFAGGNAPPWWPPETLRLVLEALEGGPRVVSEPRIEDVRAKTEELQREAAAGDADARQLLEAMEDALRAREAREAEKGRPGKASDARELRGRSTGAGPLKAERVEGVVADALLDALEAARGKRGAS